MSSMLIVGICLSSFLLYVVGVGIALGHRNRNYRNYKWIETNYDNWSIFAYTWPATLPVALVVIGVVNSAKLGTLLYNKVTAKKCNLPGAKVV